MRKLHKQGEPPTKGGQHLKNEEGFHHPCQFRVTRVVRLVEVTSVVAEDDSSGGFSIFVLGIPQPLQSLFTKSDEPN